MRVAVPLFGSRVSPRFDCAQVILFVLPDKEGNTQRKELTATTWTPDERINRLVQMDIEAVICGGIDRWSAESLRSAGITVYDSITGEADEALAALGRGELEAKRRRGSDGQVGAPPSAPRGADAIRAREAVAGSQYAAGHHRHS